MISLILMEVLINLLMLVVILFLADMAKDFLKSFVEWVIGLFKKDK